MSMPTNGGPAGHPDRRRKPPQLNVLAQYIKDFSFENPNAPRSLQPAQQQPTINIQINVSAKPLAENDVEVELKLDGKAESVGQHPVPVRAHLCGRVPHPERPAGQDMHPLMMIECPRLLFPFAREIVSSVVQNGGFPPLRIDPVDFVGLYRQRMAEMQAKQPQQSAS